MAEPEIIRFPNDVALAEAAAKEWLGIIPVADASGRPFLTALSGGRIVRRFFQATVNLCRQTNRSLGNVHFFWGDERCVPPDDPESNFGIAQADLLQPLNIPTQNVHRIHGEEKPSIAAQRAVTDLQRLAPANQAGQPVMDLIFLGMGEDGHVASLFPAESESTRANPAIYRPVVATKPPPNRITVGYSVIAAARNVWVLASGAGKSDALRASLRSDGETPLARALKSREKTRIFTDISF